MLLGDAVVLLLSGIVFGFTVDVLELEDVVFLLVAAVVLLLIGVVFGITIEVLELDEVVEGLLFTFKQ